jgi:hypothetical protein
MRRGEITFPEDQEGPLYENTFLFCLAKLLVKGPFRHYQATDKLKLLHQLLEISVDEHQRSCDIDWREDVWDDPFFENPTTDSGVIEKAERVHDRHMDSCYRAGMPNPFTFHDGRRRGLTNAGK